MKPEKEKKTPETSANPPQSKPAAIAEVAADNGPVGKRIGIKLTDDNVIDFASLRANTKKAFVEAIQKTAATPEGLAALGLKADAVSLVFSDEFCEELYDKIGSLIEVPLFKKFLHLDDDLAATFAYTEAERKQLAHPTAVVMSKWIPATGAKWKDEVFLLVVLVGLHQVKIEQVKRLQAERDAKKMQPVAASPTGAPGSVNHPAQQRKAIV